jgi:hypothetical protein
MDEKITLTKVNIVGMKYVHCFWKNDGTPVEVEISKEEYDQLATPEHINPTMEGAVWAGSMGKNRVDTLSGDLEEGQYFEEIGGNIVAKLEDGKEHVSDDIQKILNKREEVKTSILDRKTQKITLQKVALSEQLSTK